MYATFYDIIWGHVTVMYDEVHHTLSTYYDETRRCVIKYLDTDEEEIVDLITGLTEMCEEPLDIVYALDLFPKEMQEALISYFEEKYDAKYFARKCIQKSQGTRYLFVEDIRLLAEHRDTGLESLYMIDPVWVRVRIKNNAFDKLSKAEKRLCINAFREASESERRQMRTLKDLREFAQDRTYLMRKSINAGKPAVCKLSTKDLEWVLKHHPNVRKTMLSYYKMYSLYLEYEYTLERDVTDPYWRYNKNWYQEFRTLRLTRRQTDSARIDRHIKEEYAKKICPETMIEGFTFEVTNDAQKWRRQARKLHQCIISCQYYAHKKSTIVLCTKDKEPYATFEVREHKIVQSYKDEKVRDPELMNVEEACTNACLTYIQENNI